MKRLKRNKYKNRRIELDGITFDSLREARRYKELKLLERNGDISTLELQPRFELLAKYKNGEGKSIRKMDYVADFKYIEDGQVVVEDTKGMRTQVYNIKKKLFEKKYYPLVIREI